jgi:glutamate synthase domain-containing protein 2
MSFGALSANAILQGSTQRAPQASLSIITGEGLISQYHRENVAATCAGNRFGIFLVVATTRQPA